MMMAWAMMGGTLKTKTWSGTTSPVGVVVVHTVRNGDCAFDAMGLMVGEPRTEARRRELRFEVVDYMLKLAENAALHRALAN